MTVSQARGATCQWRIATGSSATSRTARPAAAIEPSLSKQSTILGLAAQQIDRRTGHDLRLANARTADPGGTTRISPALAGAGSPGRSVPRRFETSSIGLIGRGDTCPVNCPSASPGHETPSTTAMRGLVLSCRIGQGFSTAVYLFRITMPRLGFGLGLAATAAVVVLLDRCHGGSPAVPCRDPDRGQYCPDPEARGSPDRTQGETEPSGHGHCTRRRDSRLKLAGAARPGTAH